MKDKHVTVNFSLKTILIALAIVTSVWLFIELKEIVILFFLAFIFSTALDPLVDILEKKKIHRVVSISGIYLFVIVFLALLFRSVIPPAVSQISTLAVHKEAYIDKVLVYFNGLSPEIREAVKSSTLSLAGSFAQARGIGIVSSAFGVFSGLVGFVVVLAMSFYLLLEKDGPEKLISSYVPTAHQAKTRSIVKKVSEKMSLWFRGQLLLGLVVFALVYIGLVILKVDFALTLAITAGFMELLPVIGPIISGGLAAMVALTTSPFLALIVVVLFVLIHQIENHILVPQIMRKAVGLHPVTVIIALLIGGKLLGILGIIISVPVAATFSVLFKELYKNNK